MKILCLCAMLLSFAGKAEEPEHHDYPVIYKKIGAGELDERKQRFVEKNGSSWQLRFDDFGLIYSATTFDPKLIGRHADGFTEQEARRWTKFVTSNSDFFGVDEPLTVPSLLKEPFKNVLPFADQKLPGGLSFANGRVYPNGYELPLEVVKGKIKVDGVWKNSLSIQNHRWPHAWLPSAPKLTPNEVAERFVGKEYTYITDEEAQRPRYPCDPRPGDKCGPSVIPRHTARIKADDLTITLGPQLVRNQSGDLELRLLYVVRPKSNHAFINPQRVDAMTGALVN